MSEKTKEISGALSHMKKSGVLKVIILACAVGIVLLLIGNISLSEKDDGKAEEAAKDITAMSSYLDYKARVESEVDMLCKSVSGVNASSAVVFFDRMGGSIYAQNSQSGSQEKQEYVIIGSGSSAHPLYIGESLPQISGIGVVCDTGGNSGVRDEVAVLLSATYGLPLTRVYVSEGK